MTAFFIDESDDEDLDRVFADMDAYTEPAAFALLAQGMAEHRAWASARAFDLVAMPALFFLKFAALAVLVAALQGCASFTKPARELRVTEYSGTASPGIAGAPYVSGDLQVNGCRVVLSETDTPGCLQYQGSHCSFASLDCGRNTLEAVANGK